jgi:hypothetical protein
MVNPIQNYSFILAVAQIYPLTVTAPEILREASQHLAAEWALRDPGGSLEARCAARELFAANGAREFLQTRGFQHILSAPKSDGIDPSIIEFVLRECYPKLKHGNYDHAVQALAESTIRSWYVSADCRSDVRHIPWEFLERAVEEAVRFASRG